MEGGGHKDSDCGDATAVRRRGIHRPRLCCALWARVPRECKGQYECAEERERKRERETEGEGEGEGEGEKAEWAPLALLSLPSPLFAHRSRCPLRPAKHFFPLYFIVLLEAHYAVPFRSKLQRVPIPRSISKKGDTFSLFLSLKHTYTHKNKHTHTYIRMHTYIQRRTKKSQALSLVAPL